MKNLILTITILAGVFTTSLVVTGCDNNKKGEQQERTGEHQHMESDDMDHSSSDEVAYACPMHPEITGKKGDNCSKCGMALEPVKETEQMEEHEGHQHD